MASIGGYQLSSEILGHTADVRAVRSFRVEGYLQECVLTASRDGTAGVWGPEGGASRDFLLKKVMRQHSGFVSALCVIPADPSKATTKPLVVTGSQDKTILVHSLEEGMEEPLEVYTGHTALVTCIIYQNEQLISASWDSSIRVWKSPNQCEVIQAHKPAVWSIAGLFEFDGSRRILSGGADRVIKLWEVDTKLCLQEYVGHSDVVRDVKVTSSETFLSASNDCTIRKWNIHSGQCLRELYGHEAFVYSLSLLPHGGPDDFASCGEDGSLRVWKEGECVQVIHLPATSVWSVWCMENEDIITGSSDGVARVFTASQERKASPDQIAVFEKKVTEHKSSGKKSDIDVSSLSGPEALAKPGRKAGDTIMINNDGVAEVYQWSEDTAEWIKIGDAIGQAPQNTNVYNGKEYDYVFDIELDEGSPTMRKLKLPYNRSDDPYLAASEFLDANNLPAMYLDQVAEFIIKNAGEYQGSVSSTAMDPFTGASRYVPGGGGGSLGMPTRSGVSDPFTGGSRYQPSRTVGEVGSASARRGGADPFTGGSSYRPQEFTPSEPQFSVSFKGLKNTFFPTNDFKTFTSPEDYAEKVVGKIKEFNSTVIQAQKLSEQQIGRLQVLGACLTSSQYSTAPVSSEDLQLIQTILKWPPENTFPGLDLLRLALLNNSGSKHFISDVDSGKAFLGELLAFAIGSQAQTKNQLLVLRSLVNIFAKETGIQLMDYERSWLLSQIDCLFSTSNRGNQIALATLIYNYCHHYSKSKAQEGIPDCIQYAAKVLKSSFDNEAKFRVLIGIGNLTLVDRQLVKSTAVPYDLVSLVEALCNVVEPPKISQCAEAVLWTIK